MNAMETLGKLSSSDTSTYDVNELQEKCYAAMDDDFNTPILIARLFDGVRIINSVKDGKESLNATDLEKLKNTFDTFVTDILGFVSAKESGGNDLTNEVMEVVLKLRENAKTNKDFDSADLIREELNKLNIQVKDGRNGSSWEVKS
jgi:cysteinyl-tRNA synthetase